MRVTIVYFIIIDRCLKLGAVLELIRLGFRYLNMNTVATFIQASSEVFGLTILDSS